MNKHLRRTLVVMVAVVILCEVCLRLNLHNEKTSGSKQVGTYTRFLAPWNLLVRKCSPCKTGIVDPAHFAGHDLLQRHWRMIRNEGWGAFPTNSIPMSDLVNNTTGINQERKWNVVELFWYGHENAANQRLCPQTTALLKSIPTVRAAMYSILQPRMRIPVHRGPSTTCLRYHLGLTIPRDRANCFINVDGDNIHWEEGRGELFDDTYDHYVVNDTDEPRMVLFLDVDKPIDNRVVRKLAKAINDSSLPRRLSLVNSKNEKAVDTR
jgi:beta-hydroxylase